MNIQISHSWLKEFLETKATPEEIKKYLSLCSQSVEKIIKDGSDNVFDIEITSNRPDCLSVYGIARELAAILPRFGIDAKLKVIPSVKIPVIKNGLKLQVKISDNKLCPRFTALVFDNIKIASSPSFVKKRLNQAGIRSLNNVIDISNYLMLELGQPMHTFDYDKILQSRMLLREAKNNEEIVTLDNQKRILKDGAIIIEDGEGRIIDLCGIMGAKNSETDENTTKVLLFIQTYDPMKIRKTCQSLGFRTEAAARFEKGIDPEGVIAAMERSILLFKNWCGGIPAGELIDIYPNPEKPKQISVSREKINNTIGINIDIEESKIILDSLGFVTKINPGQNNLTAIVPHFRNNDISIPEDLIEEVARIYGYYNIPNILPPLTNLTSQRNSNFDLENKIKNALKYWGFIECCCYSMVSAALLKNTGLKIENHLKIINPLSDEMVYLRTSLIPSLLEITGKNNEKDIRIFEMSNTYVPNGKENLPTESLELTILSDSDNFLKLKGIAEGLFNETGTRKSDFRILKTSGYLMFSFAVGIFINDTNLGIIGKIKKDILVNFGIEKDIYILEIKMPGLFKFAGNGKKHILISKYPPIIEDFSFYVPSFTYLGNVFNEIKNVDLLIKNIELIDSYNNSQTYRITFQSDYNNLTDKEIKPLREKIIGLLEKKFKLKLKEKV